jgi:hypothetical protein
MWILKQTHHPDRLTVMPGTLPLVLLAPLLLPVLLLLLGVLLSSI